MMKKNGQITNNHIYNNDRYGIYCQARCSRENGWAKPIIKQNIIENNSNGGIYLHADGNSSGSTNLFFRSSYAYLDAKIEQNNIINNSGFGIDCHSDGTFNTISGSIKHYSHSNLEPVITKNILVGNTNPFKLHSRTFEEYSLSHSNVVLENNVFYDNQGNQIFVSDSLSKILIHNNIIWNYNDNSLIIQDDAQVTAHYNCFQTAVNDTGNISSDPQFVDATSFDFSLQYTSKCIDSGDPQSVKDPDSTRADMGVEYYHQSISGFSLLSPKNDTTIASQLPQFIWNAASTFNGDPLAYYLYYSKDNNFIDSVTFEIPNIEENYFVLEDSLEDSQEYHWKVLAKNIWNLEKWSEVWRFSVNTDTIPPVFIDALPQLTFDEDDSLVLPIEYWYNYVEDAKCPDSTLVFNFQSGMYVKAFLNDSSVSFKTESNWFGQDSLKIIVKDKSNLTSISDFLVLVNSINDPPIISNLPDSIMLINDSDYIINFAEYVTDVDTPDSLLNYLFRCSNDSIICTPDEKSKGLLKLTAYSNYRGQADLNIAVYDSCDTTQASIPIRVDFPSGINTLNDQIPENFALYQNFPNPFNSTTIISFSLPKESNVNIMIYNIKGCRVSKLFKGKKPAGNHSIVWDANQYSSGTYFIKFESDKFTMVKKCLLIK